MEAVGVVFGGCRSTLGRLAETGHRILCYNATYTKRFVFAHKMKFNKYPENRPFKAVADPGFVKGARTMASAERCPPAEPLVGAKGGEAP